MKNNQFIRSLNRINPSKEQKEKMLLQVLNHKEKQKFSWKYVWTYGMVAVYLCFFCFIIKGVNREETQLPSKIEPVVNNPKAYIVKEKNVEFLFQNNYYQEIGIINYENSFQLIGIMFHEQIGKLVAIYDGEEDNIILGYDNSYFLYQRIER